ncbi:MAG TPA: thiamine phosphate synthase [Acetobacteraceae bacterium]|nr:thiamine phosphate synthase [Acetobacteraceae bacterium]
MDHRLVAWARTVKAAQRASGRKAAPVLWLFTDAARMPDPCPAIRRLPRGLSGVVFRHDGVPGRAALLGAVAALCRARGLALVVAGDARLAAAARAGVHLRRGRRPPVRTLRRRLVTASAHGRAELLRAARAGADLVFLSPAFTTASHPGASALGPLRWRILARCAPVPVLALGGVDGRRAALLPRRGCAGVGAISALAD